MFPNPVAGVIHPASWVRPSGNLDFEVTSSFGPRVISVDGIKRSAPHNGLDIGQGRAGAPVLAQGAGRVFEYRPTVDGVVTIQTANGWRLVTAHMTNIQVRLGQAVTVGQRLGNVGNVGVSSAAHLHFENKQLVNGVYVPRDPWPLLAQNGELPDSGIAAVPRAWTGGRVSDLVVWRPSNGTWYFRSGKEVQWGQAGDIPVPADYNGDGETEIAVWRPSNGTWYIRGGPEVQWGQAGDVPVPGDYTGDGKIDFVVWRPSDGKWYVRPGTTITQWGQAGDVPVTW